MFYGVRHSDGIELEPKELADLAKSLQIPYVERETWSKIKVMEWLYKADDAEKIDDV